MFEKLKSKSNIIDDLSLTNQDPVSFDRLVDLPHFLLNWIEKNSNDVIGVWDAKAKLQFMTDNVKQLLGYDSTDLLYDRWEKLTTTEELVYVKKSLNFETKHQVFNANILNHKGNIVFCKLLMEKVIDKKSNLTYYISIIKDISDQTELKNIALEAEKTSLTGQFAAGIAHEIRNPLTSLKGFLQLLQSGISEKDVYYQIMIEEIDKIEMITSDLLLISKPLIDERKNESIYSMIHDVIVLLNSQAQLRNIKITLPEIEEWSIKCDRAQIKQVFINIIKNAIEATEPSGQVNVKIKKKDLNIHVYIIDEGFGVPEQLIHKINEPFFTTKESGTGLGLMISNKILKEHQGELKLSRNKDKGSTFEIILPK